VYKTVYEIVVEEEVVIVYERIYEIVVEE